MRPALKYNPYMVECFDYIMNTEKTYQMLGKAVGLLERRAKRFRRTIEAEFIEAQSLSGYAAWHKLTAQTINAALVDRRNNFPEEGEPEWLGVGAARDVLTIALTQRDRFPL
jgi:hypothetical protein